MFSRIAKLLATDKSTLKRAGAVDDVAASVAKGIRGRQAEARGIEPHVHHPLSVVAITARNHIGPVGILQRPADVAAKAQPNNKLPM